MYAEDQRPRSLFELGTPSPFAIVAGLFVTIGAHVGVVALIVLVSLVFRDRGADTDAAAPPEEPPEMEFIQAKLVKLGRQFDPRELPNMQREARTTAPQRAEVPTKQSRRVRIEDAGVAAADSIEDAIARLGTRADEQARIAMAAEQEGDPEGVEEGTATRDEGDVYLSQLYAFFRRGFQMPTSIPDSERRGLRAVARIQISADGHVLGYNLAPSGNAEFDQAVRLRLDQAEGARIPEPPVERMPDIYGSIIPIAFVPPR